MRRERVAAEAEASETARGQETADASVRGDVAVVRAGMTREMLSALGQPSGCGGAR